MEEKGLLLREGTVMDATIIHTPISRKNEKRERKPQMHQTRKGTSEQARVVRHQAPASPVSTGLPKSCQSFKGTCSEVPKGNQWFFSMKVQLGWIRIPA